MVAASEERQSPVVDWYVSVTNTTQQPHYSHFLTQSSAAAGWYQKPLLPWCCQKSTLSADTHMSLFTMMRLLYINRRAFGNICLDSTISRPRWYRIPRFTEASRVCHSIVTRQALISENATRCEHLTSGNRPTPHHEFPRIFD